MDIILGLSNRNSVSNLWLSDRQRWR